MKRNVSNSSIVHNPPSAEKVIEDRLLSEVHAADYLDLAVSTLQKRRIAGLPPRWVKLGRLVKYRKSDLDDWIRQSVVNSTSECA